jgi:uncharacterized protein Veg
MDISEKYPKIELIQSKHEFGKTRYNLSHILTTNIYVVVKSFNHF